MHQVRFCITLKVRSQQSRSGQPTTQLVPGPGGEHGLLRLQRLAGNRAVSSQLTKNPFQRGLQRESEEAVADAGSIDMERARVEVKATKLGGVAAYLGSAAMHLFIVATDPEGRRTAYRGGPGGEPGGLLGPPLWYGTIEEAHGRYDSDFPDWDPEAPTVVSAAGEGVAGSPSRLTDAFIHIERRKIGYRPLGPNSNTAVRHALQQCGLPEKKPDVTAPGWDATLEEGGMFGSEGQPAPAPVPGASPVTPPPPAS